MTRDELQQHLQKQLDLLSMFSPEGIALQLRRLGVRGVRHDPDNCPIANFITSRAADEDFEGKGSAALTLGSFTPSDVPREQRARLNLPDNVSTFILRFDSGEFNYLLPEDDD